jgi:diadenosine tetraphosphate (Ap4A) HIT family hydrolase
MYMVTPEYAEFEVVRGTYWTVFVYVNQSCLGSVYFWPERTDIQNLGDLSPAERSEFIALGIRVQEALRNLFAPDRFEWASRFNPRTHFHLVPRYEKPRTFCGHFFQDRRFRKQLSPHVPSYRTPRGVLPLLRDHLIEALKSSNPAADPP